MTDATDRFALPFLAPGQAQKEMFHNEALARIDALVQPAVEAVGIDTPPPAPAPGQCWIVGTAPVDAFAGQAGAIAAWTSAGWRFVAPRPGTLAWSVADGCLARYDGTGWAIGSWPVSALVVGGRQVVGAQQPAPSAPAGGAMIDAEARAAIASIIVSLRAHGLIAL